MSDSLELFFSCGGGRGGPHQQNSNKAATQPTQRFITTDPLISMLERVQELVVRMERLRTLPYTLYLPQQHTLYIFVIIMRFIAQQANTSQKNT